MRVCDTSGLHAPASLVERLARLRAEDIQDAEEERLGICSRVESALRSLTQRG